jgi:hypothetical protein
MYLHYQKYETENTYSIIMDKGPMAALLSNEKNLRENSLYEYLAENHE